MSEEMAILSGRGIRVDSSAPQQQGITVDNHGPHMSIDDLLKELKGANSTPVLLIPSGDGRLSAIAMNGVQRMVTTNREANGSTKKKQHDFHAWLMIVMSLAATITFTAGLTPPGGFWGTDDNGHVAGTPIMRDKFPTRFRIFSTCNSLTFYFSLMTIGMLAKVTDNKWVAFFRKLLFPHILPICFMCLGASFIAGTWVNYRAGVTDIFFFVFVLSYMCIPWVLTRLFPRQSDEEPTDTNDS